MDKHLAIDPKFLNCDKRNSLNAGEREHGLLQDAYLMEALKSCFFDRIFEPIVYAGEQAK